ncbi:MAG: ABC transporter permease subunit [Phycisphaerae bacterium]|nr:ABC transporter permease subunit [Phycisphaerae bacterium]
MALRRRDIGTWLWRLLPGNPIFLRVMHGGGRRIRHLWIRVGYLGILFFVMFIGLVSMPLTGALDDLAKGSTQVFRFVSIAQLAMICFLAPVFMGAAITQEKDSQTYNILLSTPLSNAQIVLGSLMSRLFFVLVLLIASVPIYAATTMYGGVTVRQILLSTGIAATTAVLTGSIAIALGVMRVGTRRTIFSFYLAIALYLLVVGAVGYPRSFRRTVPAIRYFERKAVLDKWADEGKAPPRATARLLATDPTELDELVKRCVDDKASATELLTRLRQADGVASFRQELEVTFFGCRLAPANADGDRMSWLAFLHPLLALQVALGIVNAPAMAADDPWPISYFLTAPHYGYMIVTLASSLVVIVLSMFYVRRGSHEGELGWFAWVAEHLGTSVVKDERRRKPRRVWHNPVAWREAATKASFTGRGTMRYFIVIAGSACVVILLASHVAGWGWFSPSELRFWLTGLFVIEFALIMLMAASSAATAITREREANTMDLLLVTPLTSGYIIRGKVRGLVSFLIPLIALPVIGLLIFAFYDLLSGSAIPVVWLEAAIELGILLVVYASFACVLGLQMSLQFRRTVPAVLSSVGIIMAVSFALGACGYGLVEVSDTYGAIVAPFTPFTAVALIVNPIWTLDLESAQPHRLAEARVLMPIGVAIAAAFYSMIVVGMYRTMIRNFDMTVRKQSA